ncbi:hypothetical protein FQZ97_687920 [compost metagenome]
MQYPAVEGQQHHDQDLGLQFGVEEVHRTLLRVIQRQDADTGHPECGQRHQHGLLQHVQMFLVGGGRIAALEQLLDHGDVTGQHQADGHAASDEVGVDDTHPGQLHGHRLLEHGSNKVKKLHGLPLSSNLGGCTDATAALELWIRIVRHLPRTKALFGDATPGSGVHPPLAFFRDEKSPAHELMHCGIVRI